MKNQNIKNQLAVFLETGKLQRFMDSPNDFGMSVGFCLDLFLGGFDEAQTKQLKKMDWLNPDEISYSHRSNLTTFASPNRGTLVRLVVAAADLGMAVEMKASNIGSILITFFNQQQPELLDQISEIREEFGWQRKAGREKGKLSASQSMTLKEAARILTKHGYKPKGSLVDKLEWKAAPLDVGVAGWFADNKITELDPINAIHRARQLLRRNNGKMANEVSA